MKKAIVIVILVVYIASIAVVNFFGLEIKVFDKIVYVDSILCNSVIVRREGGGEILPDPEPFNGLPVFTFAFIPPADGDAYTRDEESLAYNPNAVEIDYQVLPLNATNTHVTFIVDENSSIAYFDASKKTAVFLKKGMLKVTIEAVDGSGVRTQFYIRARVAK